MPGVKDWTTFCVFGAVTQFLDCNAIPVFILNVSQTPGECSHVSSSDKLGWPVVLVVVRLSAGHTTSS
jgi:hypothetical protein